MNASERLSALNVLKKTDWLQGYSPALAEALVCEGRLVRLNVGEWAQAEGDNRSGLFIVIDGLFHSYCAAPGDREVMIGFAQTGSVLGHATRFSGGPRLVTAICMEQSLLLEISESALERIASRSPEIWRAIAGSTYGHVRNALRMAAEVISLRPRERIAARLLAMTGDGRLEQTPVLKISQELLGEMMGLTRKTVNLYVSEFEQAGLIEVGYGQITLLNVPGLYAIANK